MLWTLLCIGLVCPPARALAQDSELPDPEGLSDEERLEWAKKLYLQAKAFHDDEDFYNSVIKYEQAYSYAPDKHIFAYNLGVDAWELKDCARVKQYLQLFLIKDEEHEDLQADARDILARAEGNPECVTQPGSPEPDSEVAIAAPLEAPDGELENPLAPTRAAGPEPEQRGAPGMLIGGVLLTVVGAGAVAGGGGTAVVGKRADDELTVLSTPGITGFVMTEYDDSVRALERRRDTMNTATPVLLTLGSVALISGVTLLIVRSIVGENHRATPATTGRAPRLTSIGVGPVRGGAAARIQLRY